MNNQLQIVAKLLANENIHVVRDNTSTAMFDLVNRTLILPTWQNITPKIDEMLVAHEVGHAVFTPLDYMDAIKEDTDLKPYMNTLEDARIEKLIKRKYIGLRKTFNEGYTQLHERDIFGVADKDINTLHIIDRINLYFKLGYRANIKFSAEEKVYVHRAEELETIHDVIQLAKELKEFASQQEELQSSMDGAEFDFEFGDEEEPSSSIDPFDGDGEFDDNVDEEGDQESKTASRGAGDEDEDTPFTNSNFEQNLQEFADTLNKYIYHHVCEFDYDPIIDYKTILSTCKEYLGSLRYDMPAEFIVPFESFKKDTSNNVNYLVKEFEMKKSAENYKRQQIAKSGSLDMKKIWSYKLSDDIFRRVTTTPDGKNHGMVFLLDWSGSMAYSLHDTIEQLINLATFCRRAEIKFRVLAFSSIDKSASYRKFAETCSDRSVYSSSVRVEMNEGYKTFIGIDGTGVHLLELLSDQMTNSEFNQMCFYMHSGRIRNTYNLGSTPLNESLVYMYKHFLGDFRAKNKIEKLTFVTLTDGGGTCLGIGHVPQHVYVGGKLGNVYENVNEEATHKTYKWYSSDASHQTKVLLQMIKDKHKCASLGFYISGTHKSSLFQILSAHYGTARRHTYMIDIFKDDFKKKGFSTLPNTGRDELYILPSHSTRINYDELELPDNSSSRKIAKQFSKYMSSKKTSRIVLSKFIDQIA